MIDLDREIADWLRTDIRPRLETALDGLLGTYIYTNGVEIDAIRIEDGSYSEIEEPEANGLECVILRSSQDEIQPLLEGFSYTVSVQIVLKQWDNKPPFKAMFAVLHALADQSIGQPVRVPPTEFKVDEIRLQFSRVFCVTS